MKLSAAVELQLGNLLVTEGETAVEVRPTDPSDPEDRRAAEQTKVDRSDGHVHVKAPKLRAWTSRRGGGSVSVSLAVPAGTELSASTAMGDIRCEGRLGDCRIKTGFGDLHVADAEALQLKTGAGDIGVEHASGDVDATTGTGEIRLRALDRGARVKNSNGETWVGTAGGELRIRAANGAVTVERASGGVDARSANGDLRLGAAAGGAVALETSLGEITVGIPEGVAAYLDLNSRAGRVSNELEASEAPAGGETVEVRARTGMGDIVIQRAPGR